MSLVTPLALWDDKRERIHRVILYWRRDMHRLHFLALAIFAAINLNSAAQAGFWHRPPGLGVAAPEDCPLYQGIPTCWRQVWRGHFSGGRYLVHNSRYAQVAWRDDTAHFPSARSCNQWMRDMRRAYPHVQGYWTCMPIR